jgi:prepilin-type processing-associated H-X9-DG protein
MKIKRLEYSERAFTRVELICVVVVVAVGVLAAMLLPTGPRPRQKAVRISCVNNLKEIGVAFRVWENDFGAYPMEMSTNKGGTKEYDFGPEVFRQFQIMQDDMGQSPRIVVCPADTARVAATSFTNFGNSNVSYFVGITVSAANTNGDLFLGGDRNLNDELGPLRSVSVLTTNQQIAWGTGLHSPGGNILFSDGSVQELSTPGLKTALRNPGVAPATLAVP